VQAKGEETHDGGQLKEGIQEQLISRYRETASISFRELELTNLEINYLAHANIN
jgi:hypothetical protein